MASKIDPPPVRACVFDMDGLLIDSEDQYTRCTNEILAKYGKGPIPWSVKSKLQGRPGTAAMEIFLEWAQLPITAEEYTTQQNDLHAKYFTQTSPLPGVTTLFSQLSTARTSHDNQPILAALATSSLRPKFILKTSHLESLFSIFPTSQKILGDNPRIPAGRGKPAPDIFLVALSAINANLPPSITPIQPSECLVFEDAVPGVEAARRAGMQVVWVPAPGLAELYRGREEEVLAGKTGEGDMLLGTNELGSVGDGWGFQIKSLEEFDWSRWRVVLTNS